jgi:hypothetical protein
MIADTVIVLETFRKQRHLVEYTGDVVPESTVAECTAEAEALLEHAVDWFRRNGFDLL